MQNKEKQFRVLELLARHEEAISDIYSLCGDAFRENKDFWQKIAKEEKIHARWIRNLKPKIETSLVYLETEKFTEQSIYNSIKYIEQEGKKFLNEIIQKKKLFLSPWILKRLL